MNTYRVWCLTFGETVADAVQVQADFYYEARDAWCKQFDEEHGHKVNNASIALELVVAQLGGVAAYLRVVGEKQGIGRVWKPVATDLTAPKSVDCPEPSVGFKIWRPSNNETEDQAAEYPGPTSRDALAAWCLEFDGGCDKDYLESGLLFFELMISRGGYRASLTIRGDRLGAGRIWTVAGLTLL